MENFCGLETTVMHIWLFCLQNGHSILEKVINFPISEKQIHLYIQFTHKKARHIIHELKDFSKVSQSVC